MTFSYLLVCFHLRLELHVWRPRLGFPTSSKVTQSENSTIGKPDPKTYSWNCCYLNNLEAEKHWDSVIRPPLPYTFVLSCTTNIPWTLEL